ncbi:phosphate-regulating neutral endopeptidase PHEX-like [Haemaphysalis longicornis]
MASRTAASEARLRDPQPTAVGRGRRSEPECAHLCRRATQAALGVAVVALAMINGALLTSYFAGSASGAEAALRHFRWNLGSPGVTTPHEPDQIADSDSGRLDEESELVEALEGGPQRSAAGGFDTAEEGEGHDGNDGGETRSTSSEQLPKVTSKLPLRSPRKRISRPRSPKSFRDSRRTRLEESSTRCSQPECLWYLHHMNTKVDWRVDPCDDFYGHVCAPRWFKPNAKPTFEAESIEKLMSCLDLNLRVEKRSPLRWVRNAVFLYQSCLKSNGSQAVRDKLFARLHRRRSSPAPPQTEAPVVIFHLGLQEMMPQLQSEYLEHVNVRPLAKVYLAPSGGNGQGAARRYVPHVRSPELLLKRFFLLYPEQSERDYKRLIEESLKDVLNPSKVAGKIVYIEKRLMNIVSGAANARTVTAEGMRSLGNATLGWLSHLFPSSYGGRSNLRILDQDYVSRIVDMLKQVCTPADLSDYFRFRALVEYSSLLNITPLIPLSYDTHVSAVPLRVEGCLHLVENFYKHGMRILATEALGGDIRAWRIPLRHEFEALFTDVRRTLQRYVRSWFSSSSVDVAVRKLRSMKLAYLGANVAHPTSYAASTPEFTSLDHFGDLVWDVVRRDFNKTMNYDSLFRPSIFTTSVEYNADTNTLYVPHALVTIPALFSETLHPIFVPILGAKMLQALMAAVDVRGSIVATDDGDYTNWWHLVDRLKYRNRSACFRNQLDREIRRVSARANFSAFLNLFIAENAVVGPLLDLYKQRASERFPQGFAPSGDSFEGDQVFYYVYAMGQCEHPRTEGVQIRFRHAIPARIRVNSALANDPGFQKTFMCKIRSRMAPLRRCSYWTA